MTRVPVSFEPRRLYDEQQAALVAEFAERERRSRNEYGWLTLMDEEVAEYDDWWDYQSDEDWESNRREYAHEHNEALRIVRAFAAMDPWLEMECLVCGKFTRDPDLPKHEPDCAWSAARKLLGLS